jgi:RHS repeat-associated protein
MISRVLTNGAGTVLASRLFTWGVGGALTAIDDWRRGRHEYRVDRAGRLIAVLRGTVEHERYEHDLAANVLTTASGARIVVDRGNRVVSAGDETFTYNGEGHITTRRSSGLVRYEYDGDDLLFRVTRADGVVIEHDYDFIGRRIAKRVDSIETKYFWDGGALQTELRPNGSVSQFVMLPDSPIPLGLIRDGQLYILLFDQIGTVTEAFDESGRLAWAGDYSAFGLLREEVGELDQPLRTLGQYHDREDGLYQNWFRHYDPSLGRYISADPAGYFSSQNLYWFSSNPTTYVDVDGRGSFAGTTLTLNPRCDWTAAQMRDFNNKIADINAQVTAPPPAGEGGALRVSSAAFANYDREAICASAVEKWKNDCKKQANQNKRKIKNTGKPCKDNDADHRRELVLKGENECHNMTPRNASVNRSCGSQIGNALRDGFVAQGRSLLTIKSVVAGCCKKPDSDTTPCIKSKSKWNPNVC